MGLSILLPSQGGGEGELVSQAGTQHILWPGAYELLLCYYSIIPQTRPWALEGTAI